ncbi:MAG: hypothetical protein Q8M08_12590 [Bacteroidales bacterium]|nr:hypothetical protein [Bacteroidales bacterium]
MKKIIRVLVIASLVSCSSYEYSIHIIADIPATDRHSIQLAFLDFNPREQFNKEVSKENLKESLHSAKTDEEKNFQRNIFLMVNWDLMFQKVTGDNLFFMNEKDTTGYKASRGMFSGHPKNIWLTSKTFNIKGNPYCYVIPFTVSNGSDLSCKLDSSKLISLVELYHKRIK